LREIGYNPGVPAAAVPAFREQDLKQWRLIERFQTALAAEVAKRGGPAGTWAEPQRQLELSEYLSLFLFGLFNPVVETMRGLCAASQFERVQREVCGRTVSLGSFSEAQAVVAPELLQAVFERLAGEAPTPPPRPGLRGREVVIDSTVWQVLPRMSWAFWRRQAGLDNAVRLHVEFDLAQGRVRQVALTPAKRCERAQWRQLAQAHGVDFVVRLREHVHWVEATSELLTPADRAAGVTWAGTVRLAKDGSGPRVRVVQILGQEESILIATTLSAAEAPPELIGQLYKHRWQVELFFRWLKCILGCRHWLAESPRGVALQVYLALIAAQLLVLYRGERPNRRQMEAIQFYLMGWATLEELLAKLQPTPAKKR
jgi:hypothetical protein